MFEETHTFRGSGHNVTVDVLEFEEVLVVSTRALLHIVLHGFSQLLEIFLCPLVAQNLKYESRRFKDINLMEELLVLLVLFE